jgi:hypothetical protein
MKSGRGVPSDRTFALALADTLLDEAHPRPIPKTKFAVLASFARGAATDYRLRRAELDAFSALR